MATRPTLPRWLFVDANGNPRVGAKLYTYETGTSTPKPTYSDAGLTVANANPMISDADGYFSDIFLASGAYRFRLTTSADAQIWQADNIEGGSTALPLTGGTMTGFITLHADPTQAMHAATKQYVDRVAPFAQQRGLTVVNNTTNPAFQLDVAGTAAIVEDASGFVRRVGAFAFTIDITASGVNGLDTGTEAANTWYHIWLIFDGTNARGLLSTSSTAPTMPTGYTHRCYLGAIRNNASSDFLRISQRGGRVNYSGSTLPIIYDGSTTNGMNSTSVAAFFPPTAARMTITIAGDARSAAGIVNSTWQLESYSWHGNSGATASFGIIPTSRDGWTTHTISYGATLYYWISATAGSVIANGWEFA